MKKFEDWLDKKSYSQAEERVAEATWRGALECMRNGDECNGEGYGCMLAAKIDEELET